MKNMFLLFVFTMLTGCSQTKQVDLLKVDETSVGQVDVYEADDSWEKIDGSHTSFTERKVVKLFIEALSNVEQLPGVVDIGAPQYIIELSGEPLYLWIDEFGGSVMEPEDTHILYTIEEASAKEIYELFKAEIIPHADLTNEEVLSSLEKQGLELTKAITYSVPIFGMKLNGKQPEAYELEGEPVFLYSYYSSTERQKGLEDWHKETAMYDVAAYQVFEVRNILLFHVYGSELNADLHAKFLEGLKWAK